MFGKQAYALYYRYIVLKKAMWFETERVSAFPGLSLGPNPVLIVVLSNSRMWNIVGERERSN